MIVLDTNVVSEPLKPSPDSRVIDWLSAQAPDTLYITTITVAEMLSGVEQLPKGKRRNTLHEALTKDVFPLFDERVLGFDVDAAQAFAKVIAATASAGNPISFADAAIASITLAQDYSLVTRNVRDFRGTGLEIINPWKL